MRRDYATSKEPQAVQSDLLLHFDGNYDDAVSAHPQGVGTHNAVAGRQQLGEIVEILTKKQNNNELHNP